MNYTELRFTGGACRLGLALLVSLVGVGLACAHYIESSGHHVTGMNNQIVWGLPHVFAVFLIIAASGALNVASVATVFGQTAYKPLARLSGLVAIAFLCGGLAILVLDLGRPDRLIVAMTHYNFRSIFAWNIFLYTGFLAIVAAYLWVLMERRHNHHAKAVGSVAFVWRIVLTTGTGFIFGFLVAREAYDAAVLAPLFVATSLSAGLAVFLLIAMMLSWQVAGLVSEPMLRRLKNLLGIFVAIELYFVVVFHLTNGYAAEHAGFERFILFAGGAYTKVFWVGQILIGTAVPMLLCLWPAAQVSTRWLGVAAGATVAGVFALLYVVIIGGQAYPLTIFPGYEVLESAFFDHIVASYVPSAPELGLGAGGVALSLLIMAIGLRVLPFLPEQPPRAHAHD